MHKFFLQGNVHSFKTNFEKRKKYSKRERKITKKGGKGHSYSLKKMSTTTFLSEFFHDQKFTLSGNSMSNNRVLCTYLLTYLALNQ